MIINLETLFFINFLKLYIKGVINYTHEQSKKTLKITCFLIYFVANYKSFIQLLFIKKFKCKR